MLKWFTLTNTQVIFIMLYLGTYSKNSRLIECPEPKNISTPFTGICTRKVGGGARAWA